MGESERLRLLRALRTQAQMSTDKGRAQFGLDHDQLLQLMHFAEQLREGKLPEEITGPDDKSRTLMLEKTKLEEELSVMRAKVDILEGDMRISGVGNRNLHKSGISAQTPASSDDEVDRSF